jgi:small nuclear ribonucleoprotein (snRNP)-like protein
MNTFKKILFSTSFFISLATIFGCTPEFDVPTPKEYSYKYDGPITTIAQFRAKYNTDFAQITDNIVLKGVVNGTDEANNIYMKVCFQDETGGMEISISSTGLYTTYHVGQEIFVDCKGLYVGKYRGVLQIGYPYNGKGIGKIPDKIAQQHIHKNGLANKAVTPIKVSSLSELNEGLFGKVITIDGIFFTNGGVDKFATKENTYPTPQEFTDSKGQKAAISTSGYARFSQDILPKGLGSITGIFTSDLGQWQIVPRDKNDIGVFDGSVVEPPKPPVYTGNATHTIAKLKELYNSDLAQINENIVIKGIVTSSDQTGNIFKKVYIQDETGAIGISIMAKDLYKKYIGKYGGVLQIGDIYNGKIGQMTPAIADGHIFFKQGPGPLVTPTVTDIASLTPNMVDKLVTIKNLTFTNAGKNPYAGDKPTSEELKDAVNNSIIIYTSNYASFKSTILPSGPVTITAIASMYNGKWQLVLSDIKDVVKEN